MALNVAIVGLGNMGSLFNEVLLKSGADLRVDTIIRATSADERDRLYTSADVVVIAVKPHQVEDILDEIASACKSNKVEKLPTIWSVAAGLKSTTYEKLLGDDLRLLRLMPNTPSQLGVGVISISKCLGSTDADVDLAKKLLNDAGLIINVPEESIDAVVAVSGSGPAYFYAFTQALVDASVGLGLSREDATLLATQTALGSAKMMMHALEVGAVDTEDANNIFEQLINQVASKGGTTHAALDYLAAGHLPLVVRSAVIAAHARSVEMGK
jgi:pyrroline-5-carboxylate reductase